MNGKKTKTNVKKMRVKTGSGGYCGACGCDAECQKMGYDCDCYKAGKNVKRCPCGLCDCDCW